MNLLDSVAVLFYYSIIGFCLHPRKVYPLALLLLQYTTYYYKCKLSEKISNIMIYGQILQFDKFKTTQNNKKKPLCSIVNSVKNVPY